MNGRAIVYARASRDEEGKGAQSISNQLEIARSYAVKRGYEVAYEFVDEGVSGGNFDREGLNGVLMACSKADVLIVKDLSRLGRSLRKVGAIIEYVISLGVRIVAVDDEYDSVEGEGFSVTVKNLFNEYYLKDFKDKCRAIRNYTAKNKHMNYYPKYGYSFDKDGREIIDEYSAKIVRLIFKLAIKGLNCTKIAKNLNENSVLTRSKYVSEVLGFKPLKKKNSIAWSGNAVWSILNDCEYLGHSVNLISRPKSERIIVEKNHLAIVSEKEFTKANYSIKRKRRSERNLHIAVFDKNTGKKLLAEDNKLYPDSSSYFLRIAGKREYSINQNTVKNVVFCHQRLIVKSITKKVVNRLKSLKNDIQKKIDDKSLRDISKKREMMTEDLLNGKIDRREYENFLEDSSIREKELTSNFRDKRRVTAGDIISVLASILQGSHTVEKIILSKCKGKKEFCVDVVYIKVRQMLSQTDIT